MIFEVVCLSNTDRLSTSRECRAVECLSLFQAVVLLLHGSQPDFLVRTKEEFDVGVWRFGKVERPASIGRERCQ